ncbi:hypothetical protein EJB05_37649, partial [Eragrostis curvula]
MKSRRGSCSPLRTEPAAAERGGCQGRQRTVQTVQDAVNAMPRDTRAGRPLRRDRLIPRTSEHLHVRRRAQRSRVTGRKSFADGITTMKTAPFCEPSAASFTITWLTHMLAHIY